MNDLNISLFEGEKIVLTPIDHEKDPEVEAAWTLDPSYLHQFQREAALPLTVGQVKKKYEKIEKDLEDGQNFFHFAIRTKATTNGGEADAPERLETERLLGFGQLRYIEWNHGSGEICLAIGAAEDRSQGYGEDALRLLLHYAFRELNLFRLSVWLSADQEALLNLYKAAGFVEEVRRRQAFERNGQRMDVIGLGILSDEWQARRPA